MFIPEHDDQKHSIHIALPPDRCFEFFTPEGERQWVTDWAPVYYHQPSQDKLEGSVFSTSHDGVTTWWTVVAHDPQLLTVRYSRLTPGSRAAIVDVCCEADAGGSKVTVRYRQVGLDEAGNGLVRKINGAAFPAMIEDWKARISALLPSPAATA